MVSLPNSSYFLYDTVKLVPFYIRNYVGPYSKNSSSAHDDNSILFWSFWKSRACIVYLSVFSSKLNASSRLH